MLCQSIIIFSFLLLKTYAHGIVVSPPPRAIGPASSAACGEIITEILRKDNQTSMNELERASAITPNFKQSKCDLSVCKGLQLEDNLHNVQNWVPGQEVKIQVWERIPHTGWVSVAIVDTKTHWIVGTELASFETVSMSGYGMVDREFVVTIPKVFPRCLNPGECVLQWTWFGRVVKQIYESCIDFTIAPETYDTGSSDSDNENSQKILVREVEY